jgi:glycosyltransferase involved in cell wall biosynthesis
VLSGKPGELDRQVVALGGKVHPLGVREPGFPWRFRALLRQERFDVVHCHVLLSSGFLLRLAAGCNVPVRVAQFHSSHDGRVSGPGRILLGALKRRWINRHATHILAVSEHAMQSVWGSRWRSDSRCQVIYDGFSLRGLEGPSDGRRVRREFGLAEDAPLYIHVGRMAPAKNHGRLLSMFAALLSRRPEARLLLVGRGEGAVEAAVRRQIAQLGLGNRAVLCGHRTDVLRLLEAADAMIFPSLWEGLGGVIVEACAVGTPVVASDLGCICEIAARLPLVRCIPLEADDRQWAEAIARIPLATPREPSRQAARRTFAASPFTIEHCAQATCRVWRGLARRHAA